MYRIGVDVGGTFTDFVLLDSAAGTVRYLKIPSTSSDPSIAIDEGIKELLARFDVPRKSVEFVGHGTTVATNMILEQRGSPTGLLTTKGFRDVLAIGRQTRPSLYDYSVRKPVPLVERYRRIEIGERLRASGEILHALPVAEVEQAAEALKKQGVEAIAICFLHSYRNPEHEQAASAAVKRVFPQAHVSISSDILPEFREYERCSTTVINAYVLPKMKTYLDKLQQRISAAGITSDLLTVHSNGGLVSLDTAARLPILTCLSGPAAGVVGAAQIGALVGMPNIITFDVGGTSTDVSLIADGRPQFTAKREINGYPLKVPMIDIHVIGAGGGSIAAVDDAGAMKVGPQSAGAMPGPAAYDRGGTEPTLADANIVLRRLNPKALLNGQMPIKRELAQEAIEAKVARPANLPLEEAAHGMIRIANATMSRAIRSVSVENGHDLRDFALVAFGGAGPLHAAEVAAECGIPRVLVPPEPGTMCACGVLMTDISLDFVRTRLAQVTAETWASLCACVTQMRAEGDAWLGRERVPAGRRRFEVTIEARYRGQTHEIPVHISNIDCLGMDGFVAAFREAHVRAYAYDIPNRPLEAVNARVRAVGLVAKVSLAPPAARGSLRQSQTTERSVYFGNRVGWTMTPVYDRLRMPTGPRIGGPAIIEEMSSTTVILPGQSAQLDTFGNILIDIADAKGEAGHA